MDESLKRLGLDHVDLFQLHNPLVAKDADDHMDVEIALNEVVPALHKLQKAGKTRFIGFSGVGEPAAILKAVDSKAFDTVQVVYNALNPSAGGPMPKGAPGLDYGRLLDRAKAADMGTIIIRALAGGALSGTEARHPLAMQVVDPIGSAPNFAGDVARAKQLEPLVRDGIAGSLVELAQRFVIAHPGGDDDAGRLLDARPARGSRPRWRRGRCRAALKHRVLRRSRLKCRRRLHHRAMIVITATRSVLPMSSP